MMFLYNAFKPKGMEVYNDTVYFNISPVLLIILTLVCYYILKLTKILTKGGNGSGVCKVEIKVIIPFESLGGNGFVKGFPPDKVKIDGKEICKSIYIGICNDVLKGDVKAIIPYELVKISE